jgi:hypothetical protein
MARALRLSTEQFDSLQKRRKYGNTPTDGRASRKESNRAIQLRAMQARGEIYDLREQVTFELIPEQHIDGVRVERACNYVADFVFKRASDDVLVCEDAKGYRTKEYRLKRKFFLYRYGFQITEV